MTAEQAVDTAALDAELAERLFGYIWRVHQQDGRFARTLHSPGAREDAPLATGDEPLYVNSAWPERPGLTNVYAYSTTGDGEQMIREALAELGWTDWRIYYGDPVVAMVEHARTRQRGPRVEGVAGIAPTAVALAALAALDAERGGD